jgi:hypothetical protein
MSVALLLAAAAAFVPVSAGHPMLASSITTISDAARAAIDKGGMVSCRASHDGLAMNVCLTADEWRAVLEDATEFEKRDRRRLEEWHSLTLRRLR